MGLTTPPEAILSPTCPRCGQLPTLAVSIAQAFCGTEGCQVFCWDMRDPPDVFERQAVTIDLYVGKEPTL